VPGILTAVLVGLVVFQVAIFLTTIYLHRTVAHRSVTMDKPLFFVCRLLIWLTTGIRPRQWAAVHRKHHAYTDILGDPHSPVLEGYWKVQLNNIGLYRKAAHDKDLVAKYAKDLPADRWDKVLFDHALLGLGLGVVILWVALGWELALVAAAVHTVAYLFINSAVNAIGHKFGKRPYAGIATNNQWLALLSAGEGLHSNHHAAPTSAKLAFKKGEIDPGWWVISAWKKFGWLTVRHSEIHFKPGTQAAPEPELV
jgi:stearoyl-CoA desaturase (delta-9 desaturase)